LGHTIKEFIPQNSFGEVVVALWWFTTRGIASFNLRPGSKGWDLGLQLLGRWQLQRIWRIPLPRKIDGGGLI